VITLRNHSLSLFFLTIFFAALIGQAIAGNAEFNNEAIEHGSETLSFWSYLASPDFGQAVMENWQSEYLQFTLFIFATVWFVQKGSPESKQPQKAGRESDEDQKVGGHAEPGSPRWARARGFKQWLYANSLLLVMLTIWLGSWLAQSLTGWRAYNEQAVDHEEPALGWVQYLGSADFWEATLTTTALPTVLYYRFIVRDGAAVRYLEDDDLFDGGPGAVYDESPEGESTQLLRIGDVARRFDISLRTLRFYEDKGLIAPLRDGNTRLYSRRDVARIGLVLRGRKIGFTLREVKHMLDLYNPRGSNARQQRHVIDKSEPQLSRLEEQRRELDEAISELKTLIRETREFLDKQAA
jgi:DNA-binding transcriptional MerR regulator